MPYQIQFFDDVALPVFNPQQDHSPAGSESALLASVGGYFDRYGERDSNPALAPISLTGDVLGENEYLGDETGGYVVDEGGGLITSGSVAAVLRARLAELKEKVRTRGTLWRLRLDDDVREWKTARFLHMSQPQNVKDRLFKANVTCVFESTMAAWRAESPNIYTGVATPSVSVVLVAQNPGETVYDAIATITCASGTITRVDLACPEAGVAWTWTGILASGQVLVVNAGTQAAAIGAVDAYNGFTFSGTTRGIMPVPSGIWVFTVAVVGGNGNVNFSFYPQFQ